MPDTQALVTVEALHAEYPLLGEQQLGWIAAGDVDVFPGRDPRKPVLRWAAGNTQNKRAGSIAPGTGVAPNHVDAANGRRGAIKNTSEYIALAQRIVSPEDGAAFEEVMNATVESAIGGVKNTKVDCPECGHHFWAELKSPGDPRAQKLIIELFAGGAVKRSEIDINMKSLQVDLSELVEIDPTMLKDLFQPGFTEDQLEERRRYVELKSEEVN